MWGIVHQKIFQENSYGYLHENAYRIYSSKTIHNASFQLISCQKICKKYVLTSNRELRIEILQTLNEGVKNVSIEPLSGHENLVKNSKPGLSDSLKTTKGYFKKYDNSNLPFFTSSFYFFIRLALPCHSLKSQTDWNKRGEVYKKG